MKTLKTMILSVGAVAVLGAGGLYAQSAKADIPFEFSVQNTTLPAGEYTMQRMSATSGLMMIRNVETGKAVAVLAPSNVSEYKGKPDRNVALFHQIGDRYFLAEVKTSTLSGHVGKSKLERELASEGSGQTTTAAVIIPVLNAR